MADINLVLSLLMLFFLSWSFLPEQNFLDRLDQFEIVEFESENSLGHSEHTQSFSNQKQTQHIIYKQFKFQAFEQMFNGKLVHKPELFSPDYFEQRILYKDGIKVSTETIKTDSRHCAYSGYMVNSDGEKIDNSLVSLTNCGKGFQGILRVQGEFYGINAVHRHLNTQQLKHKKKLMSRSQTRKTKSIHRKDTNINMHIVYKLSDVNEPPFICGVKDNSQTNIDHKNHRFQNYNGTKSHQKMHILGHIFNKNPRRSLFQTPKDISGQRYVETMVFNDKLRYEQFVTAVSTVEEDTVAVINIVDDLYKDANLSPPVSVVLIAQKTWTTDDPYGVSSGCNDSPNGWTDTTGKNCASLCPSQGNAADSSSRTAAQACCLCGGGSNTGTGEVNVDELLSIFHDWRTIPNENPEHDNGMLFSGYDFEGGTVGYAGVGTMCFAPSSGSINQIWESQDIGFNAAVVAHEMGHNFGMRHDTGSPPECPTSGFIMNSGVSSSNAPVEFSECSKNDYNTFRRSCLDNKPTTIWGNKNCGDGFVQAGETCDCGSEDCSLIDPCCDGRTCRLEPGAQCSQNDPCCDTGCRIILTNVRHVCRSASGPCDVEEVCDGQHGVCPENRYKGPGTVCADPSYGDGKCYGGICQSKQRQCKTGIDQTNGPYSASIICQESECATLTCGTPAGTCAKFQDGVRSDQFIRVADGVPCSNGQCLEGSCRTSTRLNPHFIWNHYQWSNCYECSQMQQRIVQCMALRKNGDLVQTEDFVCSPGNRPKSSRKCLNLTLECSHEEDTGLNNVIRNLGDRFNALDKAAQLRALIPRFGPSEFEPHSSTYLNGVLVLVLPGILISVVTCLWGQQFYKGKGVGCGKWPDEDGYDTTNIVATFVLLIAGLLMCLGFGITGLFYNQEINRALTNDDIGILSNVETVWEDSIQQINMIKTPLDYMSKAQEEVFDKTVPILNSIVPPLRNGVSNLISEVRSFETLLRNMNPTVVPGEGTVSPISYPCTLCDQKANEVAAYATLLEQNSNPFLDALELQLLLIQASMGDLSAQFTLEHYGSLTQVQREVNTVSDTLLEKEILVTDVTRVARIVNYFRYPITLVLLLVPFGMLVTSITGGFLSSPIMFKWTYHLAWFCMAFMPLLFSIHIPLCPLLGDSCEYLNTAEKDFGKSFNLDPQQSALVTACMANTSIVAALNLTDQLNQIAMIELPSLNQSYDNVIPIMTLRLLKQEIDVINASSLGLPVNLVDTSLSNLNSLTTETYDRDNVSLCCGITPPPGSINAKDIALTTISAEDIFNNSLNLIKQNMTSLVFSGESFVLDIQYYFSEINRARDLVVPLLNAASNIQKHAHCDSVGIIYATMKKTWCDILITGLTFMTLATLVISILLPAMIYFSIQLSLMARWNEEQKEDMEMEKRIEKRKRKERKKERKNRKKHKRRSSSSSSSSSSSNNSSSSDSD